MRLFAPLGLLLLLLVLTVAAASPFAAAPAKAAPTCTPFAPFTDPNGVTCCTNQTVAGPGGVGTYCAANAGAITPEALVGKIRRGFLGYPYDGQGDGGIQLHLSGFWFSGDADDPYGSASSTRIGPVSTSTGVAAPGMVTHDLGVGADGHFNATRLFDMQDGVQRLTIGGNFDYDSLSSSFTDGSMVKRNVYDLGPTIFYGYRDAYALASVDALWGDGASFDGTSLGRGSFNSRGAIGSVAAGNIFTLTDRRTYKDPGFTKKAAPQTDGGYRIGLDVSAHLTGSNETISGFTDTAGFVRGAENMNAWIGGSQAKLFVDMYNGGYVWSAYIGGSLDQNLSFDHTLNLPGQPTTVFSAPGNTIAGAQGGVAVVAPDDIRVGADAFCSASSGVKSYGGRVYVRFPIMRWLGFAG